MPYKSEAQRKYFHVNKKKLEKQGVNVEEWDRESKGLKLPKKSPKAKRSQ
jgi:hypothetical protein